MRAHLLTLVPVVLAALAGCNDDPMTLGPNEPPVALLSSVPDDPPLAVVGTPVELLASGSSDPDGQIVSYRFVFADGSPAIDSTAPSVTHTFATPGLYQVTLTVTDDRGATASASKSFNVIAE